MTEEDKDKEQLFSDIEAEWKQQMEQRRKGILRHKIPENRDLLTALLSMTKQELDDIRYNLCVSGISSLKKNDMAKALVPEVEAFSKRWFVTIGIEQYNILTSITRNNGVSTSLNEDDVRLDYMRCLGILFCGEKDGKQAWYMPDEVLAVYTKLDNAADYKKAVTLNDEIMRLTGGLLFYYGYMNYDQLFAKVNYYLSDEDKIEFADFMGVLINGACWQENVINTEHGMHYYTVMDVNKIESEQAQRDDLEFAELPYDKIYEAGESNYIEATDEYKAFAQFLMTAFKLDVLEAADVVGEVYILIQNGEKSAEVIEYLGKFGFLKDKKIAEKLMDCYVAFNNTSRQWLLKGHSSAEINGSKAAAAPFVPKTMKNNVVKFVPRSAAVGRNDPCPCGSGKKYKKCCLNKDLKNE